MRQVLYGFIGVAGEIFILETFWFYGLFETTVVCRLLNKFLPCSPREELTDWFNKRKKLFAVLLTFLTMMICSIYIGNLELHWLSKVKLEMLLCLLTSVAWIDGVRKIVPNEMIIGTFIGRVFIGIGEFFLNREYFKSIWFWDVLGFMFGFFVLLVIAILSKKSLGFGDVKLFGVIGLTLGIGGTYSVLFYALILSLIFGIYLIVVEKKERQYQMAFCPFVWLGYLFVLAFQGF